MRGTDTTARTSCRLCARSRVVYLGLHEFFDEAVEAQHSLSRALTLIPFGGRQNRRDNFSRYAVTCLKALTKLSISDFFPIVRRMWFGRAGNNRPT